MQVDKNLVKASIISMGYLTYDYICLKFLLNPEGNFLTEMHHICGCVGMLIGVLAGYANVAISAFTLISELSTVNLNYRSMYKKEEYGECIPQIH